MTSPLPSCATLAGQRPSSVRSRRTVAATTSSAPVVPTIGRPAAFVALIPPRFPTTRRPFPRSPGIGRVIVGPESSNSGTVSPLSGTRMASMSR